MPGGTNIGTVYIKVEADTKGLKSQIKREVEEAAAGADTKVPAHIDQKDFQKDTERRLKDMDFEVVTHFDTKSLEKNLRESERLNRHLVTADLDTRSFIDAREQIEQILPDRHQVSVYASVAGLRSALAGAGSSLIAGITGGGAAFTKKQIQKMLPDTTDLFAHLKPVQVKVEVEKSSLTRFRNTISSISDFTNRNADKGAFSLPLPSLPPFAGGLALVAGAASLAAPALAVLSGVLAGFPAVLAAGASGWALWKLGEDGVKKAAEQFDEPLKKMKESVSGVFEQRLVPIFSQLAEQMPTITDNFEGLANSASNVARGFVNTVTSASGLQHIQGIIDNLNIAVNALEPGVAKFTGGLLTMADTVSAHFPSVSRWIEDAGTAFDNWVTKVTENGDLDKVMENLGKIAKPWLDLAGGALETGFDFLKDPAFTDSMTNFGNSIKNITENILPDLKQGFQDVADIVATISTGVDKFNEFAHKQNENPTPPDQIDPNKGFGKGIRKGSILDKLIPEGWNFGTELGKTLTGENLLGGMNWDEFKRSWHDGLDNIMSEGHEGTAFTVDPNKVFEPSIWTKAWDAAKSVLAPLSITDLLTGGTGTASADTGDAGTVIGNQLGTQLHQGVTAAVQQIDVGKMIGDAAAAGTSTANIDLSAFKSQVTASVSQIDLRSAMQGPMDGMVAAVNEGAGRVVTTFNTMASQAVVACQGHVGEFTAIGSAMVDGMVSGIMSRAGAVAAAAAKVVTDATAAAKAAADSHSPSRKWEDLGDDLISGLVIGMDGKAPEAISMVEDLSAQLTGSLDGLDGGNIKDAADEVETSADRMNKALKSAIDATVAFGESQLNTAMSDLNIGGGAITAAMGEGIGWAKSMIPTQIFNVTNEDTALSLSQRKANQAKLQNLGRGVV